MSFVRTALAPLPARKRITLVEHDHARGSLHAWTRICGDVLTWIG